MCTLESMRLFDANIICFRFRFAGGLSDYGALWLFLSHCFCDALVFWYCLFVTDRFKKLILLKCCDKHLLCCVFELYCRKVPLIFILNKNQKLFCTFTAYISCKEVTDRYKNIFFELTKFYTQLCINKSFFNI